MGKQKNPAEPGAEGARENVFVKWGSATLRRYHVNSIDAIAPV